MTYCTCWGCRPIQGQQHLRINNWMWLKRATAPPVHLSVLHMCALNAMQSKANVLPIPTPCTGWHLHFLTIIQVKTLHTNSNTDPLRGHVFTDKRMGTTVLIRATVYYTGTWLHNATAQPTCVDSYAATQPLYGCSAPHLINVSVT
jgi:hypothetical protein